MENITFQCDEYRSSFLSKGFWVAKDPTEFSLPRLLMQLGLINLFSGFIHYFLSPFKLPPIVSQILGGIALGPSVLGRNANFKNYMSLDGNQKFVLDTCQSISFIIYSFLVGVHTDLGMIKNSSRLALLIGLSASVFPLIIFIIIFLFFMSSSNFWKIIYGLGNTFLTLFLLEFANSFHIISNLLMDLKLLNSELGRLALSSSLFADLSSWVLVTLGIFIITSSFKVICCEVFMILVILYVFRPIMFWMMKQTPEGKSLKELHICAIFLMVFGICFFSEVVGLDNLMAAYVFGLVVPAGPPMGTSLMEKIGCFLSAVLLPWSLIVLSQIDLSEIEFTGYLFVGFIVLLFILIKLAAVMVPSLFLKIPFRDALSLGLILNHQGLFEMNFYCDSLRKKKLSEQSFTIMVILLMLRVSVISQSVKVLYDPSRRYIAYRRRTIQHSQRKDGIRILACFHQEEDVHSIINLLEVTNPTIESPVFVYVLNLVELCGRFSPLFIAHQSYQNGRSSSSNHTRMDPIINAFGKYQLKHQGTVSVQCFTAISPYATMHDDIFRLALEKSTNLIVIVFQPSSSIAIRTVNMNILEMAPCSIGMLIDRGKMRERSTGLLDLRVCVVFLEGPDDREALAYAGRMSEHSNVKLTVLRVHCVLGSNNHGGGGGGGNNLIEKRLDMNAMNELRASAIENNRIVYKEKGVVEAIETAEVMKSLDNDFDLIMVGRRHEETSPVLMGLAEWCDFKELGVIGDMLVSTDSQKVKKASVLVVQQQTSVVEEMVDRPRFISKQINSVHSLT